MFFEFIQNVVVVTFNGFRDGAMQRIPFDWPHSFHVLC
jgi:hypothetical protein